MTTNKTYTDEAQCRVHLYCIYIKAEKGSSKKGSRRRHVMIYQGKEEGMLCLFCRTQKQNTRDGHMHLLCIHSNVNILCKAKGATYVQIIGVHHNYHIHRDHRKNGNILPNRFYVRCGSWANVKWLVTWVHSGWIKIHD